MEWGTWGDVGQGRAVRGRIPPRISEPRLGRDEVGRLPSRPGLPALSRLRLDSVPSCSDPPPSPRLGFAPPCSELPWDRFQVCLACVPDPCFLPWLASRSFAPAVLIAANPRRSFAKRLQRVRMFHVKHLFLILVLRVCPQKYAEAPLPESTIRRRKEASEAKDPQPQPSISLCQLLAVKARCGKNLKNFSLRTPLDFCAKSSSSLHGLGHLRCA